MRTYHCTRIKNLQKLSITLRIKRNTFPSILRPSACPSKLISSQPFLQPHWPSWSFSNTMSSVRLQGLYVCCSIYWECTAPEIYWLAHFIQISLQTIRPLRSLLGSLWENRLFPHKSLSTYFNFLYSAFFFFEICIVCVLSF